MVGVGDRNDLGSMVSPRRVTVVDERGVGHAGTLAKLGPAFAEIDLTDSPDGLGPDDAVRLRLPGVALDRGGRVVRSGPHLVVQLAATRERRSHLRIAFARPMKWRTAGAHEWTSARGEDLSSAGVRFVTDGAPDMGARIDVELPVLGSSSVDVRAEILAVAELGRWRRVRARFVDGRSTDVLDVIGRAVHDLS